MPPGPKGFKKPKNTKKTAARLFSYLAKYKPQLVLVIIGVIVSSAANVYGTYMLKPILDDYIVPLIGAQDPPLSAFLLNILLLLGAYIVGAFASWMYNRIMVNVSSGVLYTVRNDLFGKMQKLPLKYFDTHTHGDVMSRYTNDADAIRMMMSQSVPQLVSSFLTVISVFIMMIVIRFWSCSL